jgi:hypothetical protein
VSHDGTQDSVEQLLSRQVFINLVNDPTNRTALMRFLESFDTGMAPIVGFARTVGQADANAPAVVADLALMVARTAAQDCDLVATGLLDGARQGFVYDVPSAQFVPDRLLAPAVSLAALRSALANGRGTLTFLCTPPGSGTRIGVDRDVDFQFDGDEAPVPYGAATPPCAPELGIAANSPPRLGNELFGVVADAGAPAAPVALLIGFASARIPFAGLDLLVAPGSSFALSATTDAHGEAVVALPVPAVPALTGGSIFLQAFAAAGCGPLGLRGSRGLRVTVGN